MLCRIAPGQADHLRDDSLAILNRIVGAGFLQGRGGQVNALRLRQVEHIGITEQERLRRPRLAVSRRVFAFLANIPVDDRRGVFSLANPSA